MKQGTRPLIVGAGPVGMGAALFLAKRGIATRIINQSASPSPHSRALAVNPRTLEILEPTGITEAMLRLGLPIHGVRLWREDGPCAELRFEALKHKYPFMLALSQSTSEWLLAEALAAQGQTIERGTSLVTCRNGIDGVYLELRRAPDNAREALRVPWVLAADGAHSTVRRQVDVRFRGRGFPKPWHLVDVPLDATLDSELAHVFFLAEGFVFVIRVINDIRKDSAGAPVWRVMSNLTDPVGRIKLLQPTGPPVWSSTFHVSHGVNDTLQAGCICFAGDAAHLHSPAGARGMNLGLEDAWVFSQLAQADAVEGYGHLRKKVDQRVVARIERLSRVAGGESALMRVMRSVMTRWLVKVPMVRRQMLATVTGLDHPLEQPRTDIVPPGPSIRTPFENKAGSQA
ncbi:putative pentachlorophenol 4-monooxygenase [Verrucomicrobia bacterium]|nr:putative pentachlorophenol 4-monooxygenase [Verrucomicrobiota bacterium]